MFVSIAFVAAFYCLILPGCLVSALYVTLSTRIWIAVLSFRHPDLQFVGRLLDIRSHVDTPRNHGVHHFVFHLRGACDERRIKASLYQNVLAPNVCTSGRQELGSIATTWMFPRFRQTLIRYKGFYAWQRNENLFNIDNHVTCSMEASVRGRPISAANVQEYVQQVVSKYMPADYSPWQIEVIPIAGEQNQPESHYVLVRVHHMLLTEYPDLNWKRVLQLELDLDAESLYADEYASFALNELHKDTQFSAVKQLCLNMTHFCCNRWLQYVINNNDVDSASGVSALALRSMIAAVNVAYNYYATVDHTKLSRREILQSLIEREMISANLNYQTACEAVRRTTSPKRVCESVASILAWLLKLWLVRLPQYISNEIYLVGRDILSNQPYESAFVQNALMTSAACLEIWHFLVLLATAPKLIFEIFFDKEMFPRNVVQSVSVCGRKAVGWSDLVTLEERSSRHTSERCMAGIANSIQILMGKLSHGDSPSHCSVAVRCTTWDYFLKDNNISSPYVFVNLPLYKLELASDEMKYAKYIKHQAASMFIQSNAYQLAQILPSACVQIIMNFVTKRFPITLTQIQGRHFPKSAFGLELIDVIYFSTSQSNIGLSITKQNIAGKYRISVMSDTQFNVHIQNISRAWTDFMQLQTTE